MKQEQDLSLRRMSAEPAFNLDSLSKPVALLYKKGVLSANEVRASLTIERQITLLERGGLAARTIVRHRDSVVHFYSYNDADQQVLAGEYLDIWFKELTKHQIPAGAILDLLIDRKNMLEVDRRFHKMNGWARKQLIMGLKLWTELFLEGNA